LIYELKNAKSNHNPFYNKQQLVVLFARLSAAIELSTENFAIDQIYN